MTKEEKITRFFACRPALKKAYMASDLTIFLTRKNADLHAKSLETKKVEKIQNTK